MTIEEIYDALCSYDPRSPEYQAATDDGDLPRKPRTDCFCDNCFYGRDRLALEIIRLMEEIK